MIKSNIVFFIGDGVVKFLAASTWPRREVTAFELIDTRAQSDTEISQTLSAFVQRMKLNLAKVNLTVLIPRSRVMMRQMTLPSLKAEEIRSMLDLQLGTYIPYAREEVEVDFQILSQTADGYSKVGIVIIPTNVAMRYEKIFADAQLPVHRMTISSIGLWLLYQQQPDCPEGLGGIIDVDANSSEVCICAKSHWVTSREVPIGYTQIERDGYDEFLKQWDMTQENLGDERLDAAASVYVVGIKNLSLKVNTIALPQFSTPEGQSFASLAGVARSPLPVPIDLTPKEVKILKEKSMYKKQLIVSGLWAFGALALIVLASCIGFLKKNFELGALQQELKASQAKAAGVESQWQKVSDIEDQLKARVIFSNLARELARILPPQVFLVSISIVNGHTFSLEGMSLNPADIGQFQKQMGTSSIFAKVKLDYVNKRLTAQGEEDYFKITCELQSEKKLR